MLESRTKGQHFIHVGRTEICLAAYNKELEKKFQSEFVFLNSTHTLHSKSVLPENLLGHTIELIALWKWHHSGKCI